MSRQELFIGKRNGFPQGFTLIELMVAMLLGLIVIGGVISVFLANQQVYRTSQALGDVEDGSRTAFELMANDIRQAGLDSCANNGRISNVLSDGPTANGGTATDWFADWNNAVHGYDTTQTDPSVAVGTAVAQRVTGTPSLMLLGTAGTGLSVASIDITAANFKLNETSSDLLSGDIIIVCDPDHAVITQITKYTDSNVTLVHNTGVGVATPGNCSKGLGYPAVCTTNGNGLPPLGPNSQIAKLSAVDWYVGNSPVTGVTSLYRTALVNVGGTNTGTVGTPTPTAQEMVRNVKSMQILYHQAGAASLVAAASVGDWSRVDAVQVTLQLQSTNSHASVAATPIQRQYTFTTTVRNRVK